MCVITLLLYCLHFQQFDPLYLLQHINFYHNFKHPNYFIIINLIIFIIVITITILFYLLISFSIYLFYIYLLICGSIRPERSPFGRFFNPGMLRVEGVG